MIPKDKIKIKKSRVFDYVNSNAWAIMPERLEAIHEILYNRVFGSEVQLSDFISSLEGEGDRTSNYVVQNGAAIIPVHGSISKKMNLFTEICGGCSTEQTISRLELALKDEAVSSIIFDIDSPGGTVDGTKELADTIFAARGEKPITAFISGEGCSAAYWIASAADEIIAYDTSIVGSIGVVSAHTDYSKAYEEKGIKKTYITAGKYKRLANETEPLTKEAKDYLQSFVDAYYSMFVDAVARNRNVSTDKVLSEMADGRVFVAPDALKAGLIDKLGTIKSVLKNKKGKAANKITASVESSEEEIMDIKTLMESHPEVVAAIKAEAIKDFVPMVEHQKLQAESVVAVKVAAQEVEKFKAEAETLRADAERLNTVNKELVKQVTLLGEQVGISCADNIKKEMLADSDIPAHLHSKIMGMVDHRTYVKDGEAFVEGSESVKAFKNAFSAEVSQWESMLPKKGSVGLKRAKDESVDSSDADAQLGRELARAFAGKIRSDLN